MSVCDVPVISAVCDTVPCVSGWGETTGTQQVPATQGENPRGLP